MSTAIDIRSPYLPTGPSEWPTVDAETLASLRTSNGIMTPEQWATLNAIWAKRWFLVRANTGLVSRCTRCHRMHQFLTFLCIPLPYNSITELLATFPRREGQYSITEVMSFGDIVPINPREYRMLVEAFRAKGVDITKGG